MSGIAGLKHTQKTDNINDQLVKILTWNLAYGDGSSKSEFSDLSAIGICPEHITSTPVSQSDILHKNTFYGVIDAVLYNRDYLVRNFKLPASLSDEELLFELVTEKGISSLADVNGDFAGAVIDSSSDKLILFRDHLGIRPLFYYRSNSFTAFSTDMRGIVALDAVPGEISSEWLYKHICGHSTNSPTQTEVQDVFLVPPASFVTISTIDNRLNYECTEYWKLGSKKCFYLKRKDYYKALRTLITDSIKRRLDVFPGIIGSELSGGLDSGVISILINRIGREAIYDSWSDDPIDTPLVENDERYIIKDICSQENITCQYASLKAFDSDSNLGKSHEAIGLKYDPKADLYAIYALPLYINTLPISETAQHVSRRGGKVVFTGHGGDEGVSHRCNSFELYYHGEYLHYIKLLWDETAGKKYRIIKTAKAYRYYTSKKDAILTKPFVHYKHCPQILSQELKNRFEGNPMPVLNFAYDAIQYINDGNTNVSPQVTALLGAYSGARYVYPYLDKDVIDFAVSIPRHLYLKNGENRYIFRETFKSIIPKSLYKLTSKSSPSEEATRKGPSDTWWTDICELNHDLLSSLDRSYWARYLNYEELDKWINSPCPSEEKRQDFLNVSLKLRDCLRFQNMVNNVKGLNYQSDTHLHA